MVLAPADFYAYSRATGVPVPEDPEERAQMAPEVLAFRRNQLVAPREESNLLQNLGLAAAGVGAAGLGFLGARRLLRRQPASPEGLVSKRQPSNEAVREIANFNKETPVQPSKEPPVGVQNNLTSFLRDLREREELRSIPRPTTPYRPGSIADRVARQMLESSEERNPESPSYISKLNERKAVRAQQNQELADAVRNALLSGEEQSGYDLSTPQVETAGKSSQQALNEAKERRQQRQPAPITRDWNQKLFDDRGMLRTEVILNHLGDDNVVPRSIAQQLMSSAIKDARGNVLSFKDSNAVFTATRHVRENLLAHDYQDSIKNYLVTEPGDYQAIQSRGFGWSAKPASQTDVVTVQRGEEGKPEVVNISRKASGKFDVSDYEPLYLDEHGNLIRKSDIGTSGTPDASTGTGIGEEVGQAVAFVPREEVAKFVASPGATGSGTERYKGQGVGYAIGGVKEFGGSSGAGTSGEINPLPVLSVDEHIEQGSVGQSSNGNIYAKVKPISLVGDSRLQTRLDQDYGNFFYKHPVTGKYWQSPEEAAAFVNQVHEQFNQKQLGQINTQLQTTEVYRGPLEVALSDPAARRRKTFVDPYQRLSATDESTLSSQMQDILLQKGVIQETQTEEGAKYLRQTRYSVPEIIDGKETKMWTLGLGHVGQFEPTLEQGKRNNYEYLQAVQNAYESLTGNRLADLDLAITLHQKKGGQFLGGPSANPYLNKALTIANTITQVAEPTRQRVLEPGATEQLSERYGLGASVSERPSRTLPSRQRTVPLVSASSEPVYEWNEEKGIMEYIGDQVNYRTINKEISPAEIGGKRLAAAMLDYRERSGRPMRRTDFSQMSLDIANQEGADPLEVQRHAMLAARGSGQARSTGRMMQEGRRGLSAMDRISPAEEVAQTVAAYDFGETIGGDIESAIESSRVPQIDPELAARQAERAKIEPPGTTETFSVNDQRLSETMAHLLSQSKAQRQRRSGKRGNR